MTFKILQSGICIRPSAVDTFYGCGHQWAKQHLEGIRSMPNSRAAIGTGIHGGAEVFWSEAINTGIKDANLPKLQDAAVECFKKEIENGVQYGDGEDLNSSIKEICAGTEAFVTDIVEYTPIPTFVEHRLSVAISGHPLVDEVGGTIDYYSLEQRVLADLKTSKRKASVSSYVTQQSVYKYLAESNNLPVDYNLIQNVVLKATPEGAVLPLTPNVAQAKHLVNNMLDVLQVLAEDKIRPELLLRGNPKYMFCSDKYCAFYNECPYVNGKDVKKVQVAL